MQVFFQNKSFNLSTFPHLKEFWGNIDQATDLPVNNDTHKYFGNIRKNCLEAVRLVHVQWRHFVQCLNSTTWNRKKTQQCTKQNAPDDAWCWLVINLMIMIIRKAAIELTMWVLQFTRRTYKLLCQCKNKSIMTLNNNSSSTGLNPGATLNWLLKLHLTENLLVNHTKVIPQTILSQFALIIITKLFQKNFKRLKGFSWRCKLKINWEIISQRDPTA